MSFLLDDDAMQRHAEEATEEMRNVPRAEATWYISRHRPTPVTAGSSALWGLAEGVARLVFGSSDGSEAVLYRFNHLDTDLTTQCSTGP